MKQEALDIKLTQLKSLLQEKNNKLYNLKKKERLIRYSGEMNSSMFELLSEIGMIISTFYRQQMLKRSIKRTEEEIYKKIPMIKEIEQEINHIKKEHKRAFNLYDTEELLHDDIDFFVTMRVLYEDMDRLALSSPQYKKIIDDFQSKILEPNLTEEEIRTYTMIEVEKVDNQADRKMVLSLFEAVIGEVFKDSNPLEHEKEKSKFGEDKMDREEVYRHRVIQRHRR